MSIDPLTVVKGHEKLTAVYDGWPSFHDSEVLSIHLDREGPAIEMRVHLFEGFREENSDRISWRNHTVATLKFSRVVEVQLDGFNNQNVIFDFAIESVAKEPGVAMWDGPAYRIEIDSSYGVGGSFICRSIEVVSVERGIPPGSTYS